MKKILKNYFKRLKKVFAILAITIILFIVNIAFMFAYVFNNQDIINNFVQSKSFSSGLFPFTIMSLLSKILGIFIIILMAIIIIKTVFPDTKAFSSLMMKDQMDFLISIPDKLKKGIDVNE